MASDELANAETLPGSGDPPGEPGRLAAGTVLRERYRIVRFLGAGGMGAVYAAHDTTLDHAVALKFVGGARSDVERDRLRAEVRTLQGLTHRGIARTYTYDESDGEPFIVMELLDGETLAARIARGRLDEAEVRELLGALAAALDEAHRAGVVHRDVKPANVMLCDGGRVVLMDFGLARADDAPAPAGDARSVLMTTSLKGTPAYLAPEMALGRRVDARADLYSLGVLAYEALTGKLPFEADSAKGMIEQHVERVPDEVRVRRADVSTALSRLIARMMAKDPAARPASAAGVVASLAPRARRWPLFAAALVVVVAVIAVVVVTRGDDDTPRPREGTRITHANQELAGQVKVEFDRGHAAFRSSRFDEAMRAWQDAYALVPDPAFLYNMAATAQQMKDPARAALLFRRYLELAPEAKPEERARLSQLIEALEVEAARQPKVDAAPPTPHDLAQRDYSAGLAAMNAGDPAGALVHFEAAYRRVPVAEYLEPMGTAARQLGRRDEALAYYRRYLEEVQLHPRVRDEVSAMIRELEAELGR